MNENESCWQNGVQSPDPFSNAALHSYLDQMRSRDTEGYLAFWFSVGTDLSQPELSKLQWSDVHGRGDTWTVRGHIGKGGALVESKVAPSAVLALASFRKADGPVLRSMEVAARGMRFMMDLTASASVRSFRQALNVETAARRGPPRRRKDAQTVSAALTGSMGSKEQMSQSSGVPISEISPAANLLAFPVPTRDSTPEAAAPLPTREPKEPEPQTEAPPKKRRRWIWSGDAADEIGMSDRWVKDNAKAGHIKWYRAGIKVMLDTASWEEFLASLEGGGGPSKKGQNL